MSTHTSTSMLPQPPEGIEPPPEIHPFHRAGPLLLIPGSTCSVLFVIWLAEALRWSDFIQGVQVSGIMLSFMIPSMILLMLVQLVLAAIFMSGRRRAWWRTWLVLSPATLLVAAALVSIAGLFPPARRAKRELNGLLGGPVPASVDQVRLTYEGGIDPSWKFDFTVAPSDFERIRSYRDYSGDSTVQAHIAPNFYYLDYDPRSRRCSFRVVNY